MSQIKQPIRVAIVGVGNCCSALYQGIHYYKNLPTKQYIPGIMYQDIGGYQPKDIKVVAAFDIDQRKVGKPLGQAIFESPNCSRIFHADVEDGPIVEMAPIMDGCSQEILDAPLQYGFRIDSRTPKDPVEFLINKNVDILINYLPVGSENATRYWAEVCLKLGISFCNCIPVFIASDPDWSQKFANARLPLIGDDIRSQFGASIISQVLQELAFDRGALVNCHQQINIGGNSDFLNMMNTERLTSKKISKENVIQATHEIHSTTIKEESIFAGPSTWVPYLKDNKVAHFHLELEGFGGAPIEFDAKLSVCDSENSAGVVIDAIRYLKVAKEMGVGGALKGPSAWTQKTPPKQLPYSIARAECASLAVRDEKALRAAGNIIENI